MPAIPRAVRANTRDLSPSVSARRRPFKWQRYSANNFPSCRFHHYIGGRTKRVHCPSMQLRADAENVPAAATLEMRVP